jgi:putative membrane protein
MVRFFARWLATTIAVLVAVYVLPGITSTNMMSTAVAALVLGILNAFVRPVLVILTLPVTILSLGLFLLVINAVLLLLTSGLVSGFEVDGFGWAVIGSILISLTNSAVSALMGSPEKEE